MISEKFKIILGYVFICLIWGSTWLVIRLGLDSLTPLISAGLRFMLASALIFLVIRLRGTSLSLEIKSIKIYLFLGFMSFVIPFWLVYWAEQFVPSGLTSVLFGIFPFSVYIFSLILLSTEETDLFKLSSVVLGIIGITIIFWDGLQINIENHVLGLAAIVLSAVLQGLAAVVVKKWGGYLNPFSMNGPPLFIAGFTMIVLAFILEDSSVWNFNFNAIFSILYLAVFGTILAFTTYYWLLKRINAVIVSLSSFVTPIIALLLGWIILEENLSDTVLLGTLFVLMGILFGNLKALKKSYLKKRGLNHA